MYIGVLNSSDCFNTQPPEGGCRLTNRSLIANAGFNTQPPEGGCYVIPFASCFLLTVSTHSRLKAAAVKQ